MVAHSTTRVRVVLFAGSFASVLTDSANPEYGNAAQGRNPKRFLECKNQDERVVARSCILTSAFGHNGYVGQAAQRVTRKEVNIMAAELYSTHGYFEDHYNAYNLLQRFGMSWYKDVTPLLAKANELGDWEMSPEKADKLLKTLAWNERRFVGSLSGECEAQKLYYEVKYDDLKAFLKQAIAANEPIICSI